MASLAVTTQDPLPPSPYGLKLPQKPILSPKAAELKASLGTIMAKPKLFIPLEGFRITNGSIANGQLTLSWNSNQPGPFQVLGSQFLGTWSTAGPPTILLNQSLDVGVNSFWKVQAQVPLLIANPTNQPRLTWDVPEISMSDTLQDFTVQRTANATPTGFSTIATVAPGPNKYQDNTVIPASGFWYRLLQTTVNGAVIPYNDQQVFPTQAQGPQWVSRFFVESTPPSFYYNYRQNPYAVVVDSSGNTYVCGDSDPYGGFRNLYVGKFNSSGTNLWWKVYFGQQNNSRATDLVLDKDGNLLITGWISGLVDFGGGHTQDGGQYGSIFVLKLEPTAGACIWSTAFGGNVVDLPGDESGYGIGTDASGNVYVTGSFDGVMTVIHSDFPGAIGSVVLTPTGGGAQDIFLAKFTSIGSVSWAKNFGSTSTSEIGYGIAVDYTTGDNYITGTFKGTVDFSQGTGSPLVSTGVNSPFVAKFNTSGTSLASTRFLCGGSGANGNTGSRIVLDGTGNPIVAGTFLFSITIGSNSFTNASAGSGFEDIFVAKLDKTTLAPSWSIACGSTSSEAVNGLKVAPNGNIVFAGKFWKTMLVGTIPITAIGVYDMFIAALSPSNGAAQWAISYGGAGDSLDLALGLAIGSDGMMYVPLTYKPGPIVFSSTVSLPVTTSVDGALLKLAP